MLVLVLAASGGCGVRHGPPDASFDAVDALVAPRADGVTVVLRPCWPEADLLVAFHDATGLIIDQAPLDRSGVAFSSAAGIDAVTVPVGVAPMLMTIQSVHLGDVVRFEPGCVTRELVMPQLPPGIGTPLLSGGCEYAIVDFHSSQSGVLVGGGPTNVELLTHDDLLNCYYSSVFDGPDTPVVTLPPWRLCPDREHIPVRPRMHVLGPRMYTPYGEVYVGSEDLGVLDLDRGVPEDAIVVISTDVRPDAGISFARVDHVLTADERASGLDLTTPVDAPLIDAATTSPSGPNRRTVSWSTTGSYGIARLRLDLGSGPRYGWEVVAPASRLAITVPQMPSDARLPQPMAWELELSDTAQARDYASFVAHPMGPVDPASRVGVRVYTSGSF